MESFLIEVSYSQIAVFNGRLDNPFNDWNDRHVAQGFSWRPESVSFKTLIESGQLDVDTKIVARQPVLSGSRAISVPFYCPNDGVIEIASISSGTVTKISPGSYQLIFETGVLGELNWCNFYFIPSGSMKPQMLVSDGDLISSELLLMEADPA